ncbi:hypothetical protein ACJJTC_017671 [Scirpophaga incertulas]
MPRFKKQPALGEKSSSKSVNCYNTVSLRNVDFKPTKSKIVFDSTANTNKQMQPIYAIEKELSITTTTQKDHIPYNNTASNIISAKSLFALNISIVKIRAVLTTKNNSHQSPEIKHEINPLSITDKRKKTIQINVTNNNSLNKQANSVYYEIKNHETTESSDDILIPVYRKSNSRSVRMHNYSNNLNITEDLMTIQINATRNNSSNKQPDSRFEIKNHDTTETHDDIIIPLYINSNAYIPTNILPKKMNSKETNTYIDNTDGPISEANSDYQNNETDFEAENLNPASFVSTNFTKSTRPLNLEQQKEHSNDYLEKIHQISLIPENRETYLRIYRTGWAHEKSVILLIYEYAIAVESSLVQIKRRGNKKNIMTNVTNDTPVADRLDRSFFGFDQDYYEKMPLLVNAMQENNYVDSTYDNSEPKIIKQASVISNVSFITSKLRRTSPRPFIFEYKSPTPLPFSKTFGSKSWIESYRNAQRLKNIQQVIKYLEKTINAKIGDMYTIPDDKHIAFTGVYVEPSVHLNKESIQANTDLSYENSNRVNRYRTNHKSDPLFKYKPDNPGEVNLLADDFCDFLRNSIMLTVQIFQCSDQFPVKEGLV